MLVVPILKLMPCYQLFSEWDADFATEAYRQQVALAQHQVSRPLHIAIYIIYYCLCMVHFRWLTFFFLICTLQLMEELEYEAKEKEEADDGNFDAM